MIRDALGAEPSMRVDRFIHNNVKAAGKWSDDVTLCNDTMNMRSEHRKSRVLYLPWKLWMDPPGGL